MLTGGRTSIDLSLVFIKQPIIMLQDCGKTLRFGFIIAIIIKIFYLERVIPLLIGGCRVIDFEYKVIRTKRKSVEVSVLPTGVVVVRCPIEMDDEYIKTVVERHSESLRSSLSRFPKVPKINQVLTDSDVKRLKQEAKSYISDRVAHFGAIMGVMPDKVQITSAEKKWGVCIRRTDKQTKISTHKICFSYRIMLLPEEIRDYVVVHELAHIIQIRHDPEFFALLDKYMPDHQYLGSRMDYIKMQLPQYTK